PAMIFLGVTVLISAVAGLVFALRKQALWGVVLVSFLLLCAPYLQLIPYQTFSPVSDRFLFIAVWPVILLFVSLAWRLNPWPRTILLLLVALPLIFQAIQRPREWNGYETLLDADLRTYPDYHVPAFQKIGCVQFQHRPYSETIQTANNIKSADIRNVIIKLIDAGFSIRVATQMTGNPVEAVARLRELGVVLNQPLPQTQWDPSLSYVWDESKRWLRYEWDDLVRGFPYNAEVRYHAGIHMLNSRRHEDAVTHLRVAIQSQNLPEPLLGTAFMNLGHALLKSGRIAEAETTLQTALRRQQPDAQAYCLLAELYKQTNRANEAAQFRNLCPNPAQ
ncbi:MAG: hypothetical protein OEV35_08620, partial [Gallionellaceae bacterium]|nr:hypothetical protein [Gallionellaceae bacterium]